MTHDEASKKAEEIVFCDFNLGDIHHQCIMRNIPIYRKNKKIRNRTELEIELINAIAKELENDPS